MHLGCHGFALALSFLTAVGDNSQKELLGAGDGSADGLKFGFSFVKDLFIGEGQKSQKPPEPKKLKIFGANFGRTGTGSLALALKEIGYTVNHGPAGGALDFVPSYVEMITGSITVKDFLHTFEERGYDVVVDMYNSYYREAAEMGAKIVLTVRDTPDAFAKSWSATVGTHFAMFNMRPFTFLSAIQQMSPYFDRELSVITGGNPRDHPNNLTALRDGYMKRVAAVKQEIPAHQLLVFNVKEGWAPLCRFLAVPECPTTPFPHEDNRAMMIGVGYVMQLLTWVWPMVPLLPILACVWCCRQCRHVPRQKTA